MLTFSSFYEEKGVLRCFSKILYFQGKTNQLAKFNRNLITNHVDLRLAAGSWIISLTNMMKNESE